MAQKRFYVTVLCCIWKLCAYCFCFCWMEYSINVRWNCSSFLNLCWLCLLVLAIIPKGMLKSLTTIVDLCVSSFNSIAFCFIFFAWCIDQEGIISLCIYTYAPNNTASTYRASWGIYLFIIKYCPCLTLVIFFTLKSTLHYAI